LQHPDEIIDPNRAENLVLFGDRNRTTDCKGDSPSFDTWTKDEIVVKA